MPDSTHIGLAVVLLAASGPVAARMNGLDEAAAGLLRVEPSAPVPWAERWRELRYFLRQPFTDGPPPADAPLPELASYWMFRGQTSLHRPDAAVQERLLEYCERYPSHAARFLVDNLLLDSPQTYQRLNRLLQTADPEDFRDGSREYLIRELSLRTGYFRDRLLAAALVAGDRNGYVSGAEELKALAHLDPARAEPILKNHAAAGQPLLSALATGLLFGIVSDGPQRDGYRTCLQGIAQTSGAPGFARDVAIESLMAVPWEGRDAWYLELFRDPSLGAISDGTSLFSPLEAPAHQDPDRLVPLVAALVKSTDQTIRRNAAFVLVSFGHESARADALLPLLPWLFQPDWVHSEDSGHDRRNLVYSLSLVRVPECIPGLSHLLVHPEEAETFELEYAALALQQYRDPAHVPVLRQALEWKVAVRKRRAVAQALLCTGALSIEEKTQAAVAFLRYLSDETRRKFLADVDGGMEDGEEVDGQVVLGWTLLCNRAPELVSALRPYSNSLRPAEPQTAAMIDGALAILPDRMRDGRILTALRTGDATTPDLISALDRRAELGPAYTAEREALAYGTGTSAGIAAALLPGPEQKYRILEQGDPLAQRALLAAARVAGCDLAREAVGRLAKTATPMVAESAEAYLRSQSERMRHR